MVSVIIPNYNHEQFLEERIESVLNQTYQDFEVIILDDNSTDNSVEVINKYKSNPHVSHIVVNKENGGSTFKQWHKGFELAKGEWIWIAESDDSCDADLLELHMTEIAKMKNVAISYCTSQLIDVDGKKVGIVYPDSEKIDFIAGGAFIKKAMSIGNGIPNASSAVFKKEYALKANKQYMSYVAAGDRLFWIELAEMGSIVHIHAPKNYFRQHQNKVSPWKERNGTTSKEDFRIFRYLVDKGYINFVKRPFVRSKYLHRIDNTIFDSQSIKKLQQELWSYGGRIPVSWLYRYEDLYFKCCYYLFELPLYELHKYGVLK